jgi:hypothetical protein
MITKFKDFIKEGMEQFFEYPYQYNTIGDLSDSDSKTNIEHLLKKKYFNNIQDYLKQIIKKKHPNFEDPDVNNMLYLFFNLGDEKNAEIRNIVDSCKDMKKCAEKIYKDYIKYVNINFNND